MLARSWRHLQLGRREIDAAAQETFKVYDLTTHVLVEQTESLRLSWFATAGEFEHERTGRTADEVLQEVERRVRDHVGSDVREDDFTMIAVKLT